MKLNIRRSLSTKLGITTLLLAIPIFILSLGILYLQSQYIVRKTAMERANSALDATMQRLELSLGLVETATNSNSWLATAYPTPDSLLAVSRRVVMFNSHISGCSITTEPDFFPQRGRYFSVYTVREGDSVVTAVEAPYEYFEKPWYKVPKTLRKACWIDPFDDYNEGTLSNKEMIASYCKPLYGRDGNLFAVISTDLSLRKLNEIIVREHPYPNSYFIMTGADGRFFIHPDTTRLFVKTIFTDAEAMQQQEVADLGREMTARKAGSRRVTIDGVSTVVCYRPLPGTAWSLALVCPERDILKGHYILSNILAPIVIAGLLLILLFSMRIVKRAISPLYHLLDTTRQIAAGQYDTAIPRSHRRDVVGRLQNSFVAMQEAIDQRAKDKQQVAEETTLRNEELAKATQMAEEADRQKTAFIQNMTHQIRTPLNIITGFAQVLRDSHGQMPEEEEKSVMTMMDYNAKTLNRMVLMLFDSSDTGFSEELNCRRNEYVSCNEVADSALGAMMLHFPDMPVQVDSELPDDLCIHTNRLYLMRSLRELLYNAAKYSDRQHVRLRLTQTADRVLFVVEDRGPGIAEEYIENLFNPFVKVNDLSEGLGLGLSLTHRHIMNLGGELTLDTDYHDGSRFVIWLPKK
ncbi:MAG: histidine kinase [Prevotella sp.]|nr:histidine kinase [Prevotella sp.]